MSSESDISLRDYYEDFIDEILTTEIIWGLKNDDGWAVCASNDFEGHETIPFWSNEKDAQKLCVDEWQDYQPSPIPFDEFIDAWLHGMHEDEVLAGINWDEDLVGPEIEPIMLIEDLLEEE
ncbi:DUF2750 domain-containing protein [Aliikangiella sp. IMCC44359]|uniref:DUF2750 domain-containing protein n=1 Tax=Aliikangiella sp. IMCC44359 TaxID=3459125 RepID=UPI00403B1BC6